MRRNYYIDVENVGQYWLKILKEAGNGDCVYLFTSPIIKTSYSEFIPILNNRSGCHVEVWEAYPGRKGDQSLDHFLIGVANTHTYMYGKPGVDADSDIPDVVNEFIIVSNDCGYESFVNKKILEGYRISLRKTDSITDVGIDSSIQAQGGYEKKENTAESEQPEMLAQSIAEKIKELAIKTQPSTTAFFNCYVVAKNYIKHGFNFAETLSSINDPNEKQALSTAISKKQRKELEAYAKDLSLKLQQENQPEKIPLDSLIDMVVQKIDDISSYSFDSKLIRDVVKCYIERKGINAIEDILTAEKALMPPDYAQIYCSKNGKTPEQRTAELGERMIFKNAHSAIADEETWYLVQQKLRKP